MKLWLISTLQTLKRLARDRAFLLILVLLPLVMLVCSGLLQREAPVAEVRVGVVFDPQNQDFAQLYQELPQFSYISFLAYPVEELERVEQLVSVGELECAYVFGDSLTQVLQTGELVAGITLIKSDSTIQILLRVFNATDEAQLTRWVQEEMEWYRTEGLDQFLQQQAQYIAESGVLSGPQVSLAARPVHGIAALFLLALNLFLMPRFIAEKTPGLWRRLGFRGLCCYYTGVFAALLLLSLLAGVPALLVVWLVYPAVLSALGWEILALAVFAACVCMLALLAAVLLRSPDLVYASSIFLLLLVLVLGGVLFDWIEISAYLAGIFRMLPTEQYISGAINGTGCSLIWLAQLFCAAAAAMLVRFGVYAFRGKA